MFVYTPSQAEWGLLVLLWLARVFTGNLTSLRLRRRQYGNRYVLHAGLQLIDEEFRYLRTVMVTAVV
jgi:hypothetical protein